MKYTITFHTKEQDGDLAIQALESALTSAAHLSVLKTEGGMSHLTIRPCPNYGEAIDAEFSVVQPEATEAKPEGTPNNILLVGENLDKL